MLLMLTSQTANRLGRDRLENLQVEISVEKAAPPFTSWMWPWRESNSRHSGVGFFRMKTKVDHIFTEISFSLCTFRSFAPFFWWMSM
jgi:hypothetical protein